MVVIDGVVGFDLSGFPCDEITDGFVVVKWYAEGFVIQQVDRVVSGFAQVRWYSK